MSWCPDFEFRGAQDQIELTFEDDPAEFGPPRGGGGGAGAAGAGGADAEAEAGPAAHCPLPFGSMGKARSTIHIALHMECVTVAHRFDCRSDIRREHGQ